MEVSDGIMEMKSGARLNPAVLTSFARYALLLFMGWPPGRGEAVSNTAHPVAFLAFPTSFRAGRFSTSRGAKMSWAEKTLVVLLRLSAAMLLFALVPACMPFQWMVVIHRALGMGELPDMPVVGYLTRSLSAFYAMHGALILYVSFDVRRHLPVIRFLAVLAVAFGAGMLVLDAAVGVPLLWTLGEGPFVVALGAVLLWLAGQVDRK
jgi:hypothetical protein